MKYGVLLIQVGVFACAACSGAVGQGGSEASSQDRDGKSGDGRGDDPSGVPREVVPGVAPLRRLSNTEYMNTVRDLVAPSEETLSSIRLVADVQKIGFDHNADVQSLSPEHTRAYGDAAKRLSEDVFSTQQRQRDLLGCDTPVTSSCVKSFIQNFGLRALRRPLAADEVGAYMEVFQTEADPVAGARLVLRVMLQSPSFLFRPEFGDVNAQQNKIPLTAFELATRLSYLILQTTPSADLLEKAGSGELASLEDVTAVAARLLEDAAAKAPMRDFLRQAFGTQSVDDLARDAEAFPMWSASLRRSMAEELQRLGEDLIWSEGGDLRMLADAPYTFVDDNLADIYGVDRPGQGQWKKVQWLSDATRAGLVTMPIAMAVTGRDDGVSAIWRGKFVRTQLLCEDLPPPPADVPPLEAVDTSLPERERLAQHRSNPACASCHALLDPVGFGLARYDAVGRYATKDAQGRVIADDGVVEGLGDGNFRGGVELAHLLRKSPQFTRCLTLKLLTFFAGRTLKEVDDPLVDKLHAVLSKNGAARDVLMTYVESDAFRYLQR